MTKKTEKVKTCSNIHRLQNVVRTMIERIERELSMPTADSEEKAARRRQTHELLFGPKVSLADTLMALAELALKLENAERILAESAEPSVAQRAFSAADTALVDAFLHRVRHAGAPDATPAL